MASGRRKIPHRWHIANFQMIFSASKLLIKCKVPTHRFRARLINVIPHKAEDLDPIDIAIKNKEKAGLLRESPGCAQAREAGTRGKADHTHLLGSGILNRARAR